MDLALDLGYRLLPAFESPTGIPYGTVNLLHGVPPNETPITCTACATSLSIEFGMLSALSGDQSFLAVAEQAVDAVWSFRTPLGLLGMHIDVETGQWTEKVHRNLKVILLRFLLNLCSF